QEGEDVLPDRAECAVDDTADAEAVRCSRCDRCHGLPPRWFCLCEYGRELLGPDAFLDCTEFVVDRRCAYGANQICDHIRYRGQGYGDDQVLSCRQHIAGKFSKHQEGLVYCAETDIGEHEHDQQTKDLSAVSSSEFGTSADRI